MSKGTRVLNNMCMGSATSEKTTWLPKICPEALRLLVELVPARRVVHEWRYCQHVQTADARTKVVVNGGSKIVCQVGGFLPALFLFAQQAVQGQPGSQQQQRQNAEPDQSTEEFGDGHPGPRVRSCHVNGMGAKRSRQLLFSGWVSCVEKRRGKGPVAAADVTGAVCGGRAGYMSEYRRPMGR